MINHKDIENRIEKVKPGNPIDDVVSKEKVNLNDLLNSIEINDSVAELSQKEKADVQDVLSKLFIDITKADGTRLEKLQEGYRHIDRVFHNNRNQHADARVLIRKNYEDIYKYRQDSLRKDHDVTADLGLLTYATASELLSPEVATLTAESEGNEPRAVIDKVCPEWTNGLKNDTVFKNALQEKFNVPPVNIDEVTNELQETVIKASQALGFMAANLGLDVAGVFEKAFKAAYASVETIIGNGDIVDRDFLNGKIDEVKENLSEYWDDNQFNTIFKEAVDNYGQTVAVIGLSILASSGLLVHIPGASAAITAAIVLESVNNTLADAVEAKGGIDIKDVAGAVATAVVMFAVKQLIPLANDKLSDIAPKVVDGLTSAGIKSKELIAKMTGAIVKAAISGSDAAMIQAAAEFEKVIRYILEIDETFNVTEELKQSLFNIASAAGLSGAAYYFKETVRNSQAFAKLMKLFTGHEYVPQYDEFAEMVVNGLDTEPSGGSYADVKNQNSLEGQEIHHIPANSVTNLELNDGPAIKMSKEDHQLTASWGNSKEAREYRRQQQELIEQGKFREAMQMDIDDIREKFGNKYDESIKQMLKYADQLLEGGKI